MKLVLIGSGNVAKTLAVLLKNAGHELLQVYGRDETKASEFGEAMGVPYTSHWQQINPDADLYIIAISDSALPEIGRYISLPGKLVVHTAGTVSREVLSGISDRYGVLYPLQSLRGSEPVTAQFPFLINASKPPDIELLINLVRSVGADFQIADDEQRARMHLAAVWVNNFPNLFYRIAYNLCEENKTEFKLLLPLIRETALRMDGSDPAKWQTGPASRGDGGTIKAHLDMMKKHPDWQQIYSILSEEIKMGVDISIR
ncbi:Rossmann-like and DUF2520 domain-containing protein [Flavihumibacter sp.]|uniref:Rossmann-like and DUF2520 domain-containing protein n=1 Tax=Flavihumibacter sp. TaxID=1913981 RepID=UPI002FCC0F3B